MELVTTEQAKQLREDVKNMVEAQTKVTLKLAELLYQIYNSEVRQNTGTYPLYVAWNHESFDEFAEHELGLHQTTARGLVILWEELFMKRKLDADTAARIRITKLRQLATASKKVKDGRTFNTWISKAIELSCCEFEAEVKEAFGGDTKQLKPFTYSLPHKQYLTFIKQLRVMRERYGVSTNGEAIARAVSDVANAPDGVRRKAG